MLYLGLLFCMVFPYGLLVKPFEYFDSISAIAFSYTFITSGDLMSYFSACSIFLSSRGGVFLREESLGAWKLGRADKEEPTVLENM